ncbi:hypothetical protein LWE61_14180 [Sphingobium sufflavum]|uniref:hypothetical protein n=1 Tax=Sphingobium sufflavum TaxID=1129547 RepID=UPI001F3E7D8B|nr:hypothetical protein [Sphingobium sufflavum]MCE7797694.1 hypothetical protein [Sphingobium sufflavum]
MKRGSYLGGSTIIGPGATRRRAAEGDEAASAVKHQRDARARKAGIKTVGKNRIAIQKALRAMPPVPPSPNVAAGRLNRRMGGVEVLVRQKNGVVVVTRPAPAGASAAPPKTVPKAGPKTSPRTRLGLKKPGKSG